MIRDTTVVTITNPDGGTFKLAFISPKDGQRFTTKEISTKASEWDFYVNVIDYYWYTFYTYLEVNRVLYDQDDAVTTDMTKAVKIKFTTKVLRSIATPSASDIKAT